MSEKPTLLADGTVQLVEGGHHFHRELNSTILKPDYWRYDAEPAPHNGPKCKMCGTMFCHNCHPERMTEPCEFSQDTIPGIRPEETP